MRIIVRSKNGYGKDIKRDVIGLIEKGGAEWTGEIEKGCDFAIIVGGDGTVLRDQHHLECPILGINPGKSVGFYMQAGCKDYRKKVMSLLNGREGKDYHIHNMMRLEASVNGRKMSSLALNEILVSPMYVRRIFESDLKIEGRKSMERNSGIIVYTPTGSHAFAHSAGAPEMRHDAGRFGVVAIAPYSGMLKKRPLLLENGHVEIECLNESGEICMDGSEVHIRELKKGDTVAVKKSDKSLRLVGFGKREF